MEDKTHKDGSSSTANKGQESLSYQRRMWKNFQVKTKPWLSPKLGSERRSSGGADGAKKESAQSVQLSSAVFQGGGDAAASRGGDPLPGTSAGDPLQPLGAAAGPTGSKPELTTHGSPKLAVTQLILSQQKSSSLGSACFEKLLVKPTAVAADEGSELRQNNASDSSSPLGFPRFPLGRPSILIQSSHLATRSSVLSDEMMSRERALSSADTRST
ncbi:hypothetical protein NHX12_028983 [Muraenolepis orangiensis]|uniref:Uncharacterized protein n=1 Tax=Muraenolepis orangiensis TaxID=630683 RepID=A0A9Q0IKS3_9TELE|nr:hypothetical protein NHX12_028983 [Muraenolepis orangiensis]